MVEGLAFYQIAYHDGNESGDEKTADEQQGQIVSSSPSYIKPSEEFDDGVFKHP